VDPRKIQLQVCQAPGQAAGRHTGGTHAQNLITVLNRCSFSRLCIQLEALHVSSGPQRQPLEEGAPAGHHAVAALLADI
jgi:hypothetical protein